MSAERQPLETFKEYKERLKQEKKDFRSWKKGKLFHMGGTGTYVAPKRKK